MITVQQAKREKRVRIAKREKASRHIFDFIKYTFRFYKHENWHHKLISSYYQRALKGEIQRLMVFVPPRHMKTEGLERATSWGYGKNPNLKVISCAYAATRAVKSSKNIKQNVKDSNFAEVFPEFRSKNFFYGTTDKQDYWEIGGGYRGSYLAAGVNGPIVGEGFNLGIIDDPVKSRAEAESPTYQETTKEWYFGTFLNRQDEQDSIIILINTRWNPKDLSGSILQEEGIKEYNTHKPSDGCPDWNGSPDGKWVIVNLAAEMDEEAMEWKHPEDPRELGEALWPDRFPSSFLEQFKAIKYDWTSLYQGRPKVKGGNIINRAWFGVPVKDFPRGGKLIRFWDLASTPKEERKKNNPDFTAGSLLTYINGIIYVIDIKATRLSPKKRYDLMKQTAIADDAMYGSVMQVWEEEGGASGKDVSVILNDLLIEHLRAPFRVRKAKNFYIDLFANKAETGNVRVVDGPWLHKKNDGNTFYDSAEAYPSSLVHDDDIDATGKACFLLTGGLIKQLTGEAQNQEEYKPAQFDPETEKETIFQTLEKQLMTNRKIDEGTISDFAHTLETLEQLSNKYIQNNDDEMAMIILDEIDRIEEIAKNKQKINASPEDITLQIAIGQGYVPKTCLIAGGIVMGLINKGKDPCEGCYSDRSKCGGRRK